MTKTKNKWLLGIAIAIAALLIITLALTIFTKLGFFSAFRIIFGSVYVLFLPGFIISFIFFPKTREFDTKEKGEEREKGAIDWIERIALSFALSIAIVPLVVFYLNLTGLRINLLNSFLTILGIIVAACVILAVKKKKP